MNKRAYPRAISIVVVLALAHMPAPTRAQSPEVTLSADLKYMSGEYGGTGEIEDLYVPITARVDTGRIAFQLVVPYLRTSTPAESGSTTESGLGDILGSVTVYDVLANADGTLVLDVTGAVKLGTADETKGLGTGETDVTVYFDGYRFFDTVTLLASVGYRWRGEPPELLLDDVFLGSIGSVLAVSETSRLGLILDYRESALAGTDDIQEVTVLLSHSLNDRWNFEVSAFTGFTDSSPDWGAAIGVTTNLRRLRIRDDR
jgi:hypothetical protein